MPLDFNRRDVLKGIGTGAVGVSMSTTASAKGTELLDEDNPLEQDYLDGLKEEVGAFLTIDWEMEVEYFQTDDVTGAKATVPAVLDFDYAGKISYSVIQFSNNERVEEMSFVFDDDFLNKDQYYQLNEKYQSVPPEAGAAVITGDIAHDEHGGPVFKRNATEQEKEVLSEVTGIDESEIAAGIREGDEFFNVFSQADAEKSDAQTASQDSSGSYVAVEDARATTDLASADMREVESQTLSSREDCIRDCRDCILSASVCFGCVGSCAGFMAFGPTGLAGCVLCIMPTCGAGHVSCGLCAQCICEYASDSDHC